MIPLTTTTEKWMKHLKRTSGAYFSSWEMLSWVMVSPSSESMMFFLWRLVVDCCKLARAQPSYTFGVKGKVFYVLANLTKRGEKKVRVVTQSKSLPIKTQQETRHAKEVMWTRDDHFTDFWVFDRLVGSCEMKETRKRTIRTCCLRSGRRWTQAALDWGAEDQDWYLGDKEAGSPEKLLHRKALHCLSKTPYAVLPGWVAHLPPVVGEHERPQNNTRVWLQRTLPAELRTGVEEEVRLALSLTVWRSSLISSPLPLSCPPLKSSSRCTVAAAWSRSTPSASTKSRLRLWSAREPAIWAVW